MIENGIETQMSMPDTLQQNGRAERFQQTITNGAEAMRHHMGLSNGFWIYAVKAKLHAYNVTPIKRADYKTPTELQSGNKLNISHFRVFGCQAWVHIFKKRRFKLEPKSREMIFIGYEPGSKGYQFWDAAHQCIEISHDVKFNETLFPVQEAKKNWASTNDPPFLSLIMNQTNRDWNQSSQPNLLHGHPAQANHIPYIKPKNVWLANLNLLEKTSTLYQQTCFKKFPIHTDGNISGVLRGEMPRIARAEDKSESKQGWVLIYKKRNYSKWETSPKTVARTPGTPLPGHSLTQSSLLHREAMNSDDSDKWLAASQEEFDGLTEMGVWKLVDRPSDHKTIKCRWTYVLKADGRQKVRLVAKGYTQVQGIDYEETFSPVARYESIRYLLAHAALLDWEIEAMDVKLAYLHGVLDEEIYMEQPEGFIAQGEENKVCKLIRSLYGLKQAG